MLYLFYLCVPSVDNLTELLRVWDSVKHYSDIMCLIVPVAAARMNSIMSSIPQGHTKMVIDVDTGCDDSHAIMMALARPDVEVLGITTVAGNCSMEQVTRNTVRLLATCNRLDVRPKLLTHFRLQNFNMLNICTCERQWKSYKMLTLCTSNYHTNFG